MAEGVIVKNNSGHILISSDITSLHYGGKASYYSTPYTGQTNFPDYSGAFDALDGRTIWRYRYATSYTPLFFIRPKAYLNYYGIINQWQSGGYWYVDVIGSSGSFTSSQRPDIHVFLPPNSMTPSGDWGIKTKLANGDTAFDSRLKPLSIVYANGVIPPADPTNGSGYPGSTSGHPWNYATLDHNFKCSNQYNGYSAPVLDNYAHENMMFSAPSTAQAVYSRTMYGYKKSCDTYSCQEHWSTAIWWAMYHQAYRIFDGQVRAGWAQYAAGYYFYSRHEDGGWFGGGGGSSVEGNAPYDNKTINRTTNTIIIANASHYE